MVVERSERVQRRATVSLGLPRTDDEQHLRPVRGEQSNGRAGAGAEVLECAYVAAHLVRHLLAGDGPITQLEHVRIAVPLEGVEQHLSRVRSAVGVGVESLSHGKRLEHR